MSGELGLLALAVLLVLANGFFVATEFAIVRIRPTRLQAMVEEGKPGVGNVQRMLEQLDAYLSATQLGITLASLGLGWVGEPAFAHLIEQGLHRFFPQFEGIQVLAHTIALVLAFAVITLLHITVGEMAPKTLAIQRAESTALAVAWPMRLCFYLFYPGVWFLLRVSNGLLRLLGLKEAREVENSHSEEELRVILASSAATGAISNARADLLERALEMTRKMARQVMVPRNQIRYLDLEESLEKNVADARAGGHTFLPVCRGSLDELEGLVNVKDLFFLLSRGELKSLAQVQRPVLFVPEGVTLEQLLSEFRRRRRQMAVVVDEHGGTSGIVTLADVVAEVVGEVAELGRRVEEVKTLPGGRLELPGTTSLSDLEERLDVKFDVEPGEVTTIGGFLMARLGRIPERGDRSSVGDYEVHVEEMDGPRVVKVRIEPKQLQTPASPGTSH